MILLNNVSTGGIELWKVTYSCYTYSLQIIKYLLGIGLKIPIPWISTDICQYFNPSLVEYDQSLNGKRTITLPNQPITFSSKTLTHNLEIATAFAKQFTSIVPHTRSDKVKSHLIIQHYASLLIFLHRHLKTATILIVLITDGHTIHLKNLDPL